MHYQKTTNNMQATTKKQCPCPRTVVIETNPIHMTSTLPSDQPGWMNPPHHRIQNSVFLQIMLGTGMGMGTVSTNSLI